MLGIQHLDVLHLRRRTGTSKGTEEAAGEKKIEIGGNKDKTGAESTEEVTHTIKSEPAVMAVRSRRI